MNYSKFFLVTCLNCIYTNRGFIPFTFFKFNYTIRQCKQCKVSSHSDILTRMIFGTTLANDDVARDGRLAAKNFYSQAFALRVASVLYTSFTFFVCHGFLFL